ncbi:MAG: LLM class F420-dependent oxidoreductase [Acidimicrobiaceae bacterium]|nr:LLM class F420-dependent oxidoreductase [Acidimicrobiaceae bacterium]
MPRYAIKTPPHHATWSQFLDVWRAADEIDLFESAWNWDHFYPLAEPYDGPNLEGWTMLGALAQATSRIRIGAMVNGMHHRHPAVTANMAATLDHISDGRFELGMGAGWNVMESDAYGIPLGTLKERSDRFEEGMEVIVSLLTRPTTDFSGAWFELADARCEPKPVQERIPIVVGGKGRQRTLRTAARFADQWDMTFPSQPSEWLELDEVLRGHCERVGRDESEITRSIHLGFADDADPAALRDEAASFFDVGVDIVVWSMRGAVDARRLAPLAEALT